MTTKPSGDRKALIRPTRLGALSDLDHALRQLNRLNDIAIELQPEIRKLAPDGEWCADRLGFLNSATIDYVSVARDALEVLEKAGRQ